MSMSQNIKREKLYKETEVKNMVRECIKEAYIFGDKYNTEFGHYLIGYLQGRFNLNE